jgi:hypothetical protein
MKVLFVMEHPGVGSLLPALRLLHDRGHEIHLAWEETKSIEADRELEALAAMCPRVTFGRLPPMGESGPVVFARRLRRGIDYVRYLEPRFREATKLRGRARKKAPQLVVKLGRLATIAGAPGITGLRRFLQWVERCLLPAPQVERYLAEQKPDVLLLAHLLQIASPHADYLRAARRLRIPSVFPIRGWDNFTNKGVLRDAPSLVLVWNEFQAEEAVALHRVPPEHVRVTGAFKLDHWFGWETSRSREEFCREVGLRADRPIVLYVCSSGFVAPREVGFVRDWIERMRARGGVLADAGVLVRPHPLNAAQWADAGLDGEQVRVWPRFGEAPHDDVSYRNYFDSLFHAGAVVGINTTAQIEGAIVGRPVHTWLAKEFRDTQEGTLHFRYLQAEGFGHLYVGRSFEEHAAQVEESLRGRVGEEERNERFLRRFVRPHGLEVSATQLVVEAIEELGSGPAPAPDRRPLPAPLVRLALRPLFAQSAREAARLREARAREATPARELHRLVSRLAGDRTGLPVVAGPWLADEVGELLYWIPLLRWAQNALPTLRERLFVVSRPGGTHWYAGIGAAAVELQDVAADGSAELSPERVAAAFGFGSRPFRDLPASAVIAARHALARREPNEPQKRRLLAFEPLPAPEVSSELELPDEFVATRFCETDSAAAEVVTAGLRDHGEAVVSLDGRERAELTAVLARARGFVGSYGAEAHAAALLGVPAVAFAGALGAQEEADLRLAEAFLSGPEFGPLHVVHVDGGADEATARAIAILRGRAATYANA